MKVKYTKLTMCQVLPLRTSSAGALAGEEEGMRGIGLR
jgi:hypothetical protein